MHYSGMSRAEYQLSCQVHISLGFSAAGSLSQKLRVGLPVCGNRPCCDQQRDERKKNERASPWRKLNRVTERFNGICYHGKQATHSSFKGLASSESANTARRRRWRRRKLSNNYKHGFGSRLSNRERPMM